MTPRRSSRTPSKSSSKKTSAQTPLFLPTSSTSPNPSPTRKRFGDKDDPIEVESQVNPDESEEGEGIEVLEKAHNEQVLKSTAPKSTSRTTAAMDVELSVDIESAAQDQGQEEEEEYKSMERDFLRLDDDEGDQIVQIGVPTKHKDSDGVAVIDKDALTKLPTSSLDDDGDVEMKENNAEAGPSTRAISSMTSSPKAPDADNRPSDIPSGPSSGSSLTGLFSETSALPNNEAGTSNLRKSLSIRSGHIESEQESISELSSFRIKRGRHVKLVVEVPLLPLQTLRKYYHPRNANIYPPTATTRKRLPMSEPFLDSADGSRSASVVLLNHAGGRSTRRGPRWAVDQDQGESSDDLGGFGTADEDDVSEGMSSDGVLPSGVGRALERGRRGFTGREKGKGRGMGTRNSKRSLSPYPNRRRQLSESVSETPSDNRKSRPLRTSLHPSVHNRTMTTTTGRVRPSRGISPPQKKRRVENGDGEEWESEGEEEVDELDEEHDSGSWEEDEEEDELDDDDDDDADDDYGKKKKKQGKGNAPVIVDEDILSLHRQSCDKCSRGPADEILAKALAKKNRSKGKSKRKRDDDVMSDEEVANELEGWLECERCVVSSHWGCLAPNQRKDVLLSLQEKEGPPPPGQKPRRSILIDEVATFVCSRCSTYGRCFVCKDEWVREAVKGVSDKNGNGGKNGTSDEPIEIDSPGPDTTTQKDEDASSAKKGRMEVEEDDAEETQIVADQAPLLFRCLRCHQAVHYEHLSNPFPPGEKYSTADIARHYQNNTTKQGEAWFCHQCRGWKFILDIIIAWRPLPADAVEPKRDEDEKPAYKDPLPREYLVKWQGRGFRHVTWVPHPWLLALFPLKLKNFLEKGPQLDLVTDETLAARGDDIAEPTIAKILAEDDQVKGGRSGTHHPGSAPQADKAVGLDVNAESSIPVAWSTVDRVLDVMLRPPKPTSNNKAKQNGKTLRRGARILSESRSPETDAGESENSQAQIDGVEPPISEQVEISVWEHQTGRRLKEEDVDEIAPLVSWLFVKWDDLQYDQSCWDTPPPVNSPLYPAFKRALARYLGARRISVPILTPAQVKARELEASKLARNWVPPEEQPSCIVGGKLMPFQMQGLQWLLTKHYRRESCILADDMGLGKTIQIASVIGYLGSEKIFPSLVVVPNSTITNWVREFEKWVPHVRVVPFYGEASSRKIISKYELYHKGQQNKAIGLKAHVILTTYDMITGSEFRVFNNIPRWEVLCIDEGQRLKSDGSLIFNRLKQLNSVHRILMTGTPLNNNLRELFNLLNFLDEPNFENLEDLQNRFTDLNEGLVTELHEMIKPYILRRIKADVLKLPPKVEIIVPISLAPLQKHVYKGIIDRNAEFLTALAEAAVKKAKKKTNETPIKPVPEPTVPLTVENEVVESPSKNGTAVEEVKAG